MRSLCCTVLLATAVGCGGSAEPIDLANDVGKADDGTAQYVTLTKRDPVRFKFKCNAWFSCDITLSAQPTGDTREAMDRMNSTMEGKSYPLPVVVLEIRRSDGYSRTQTIGWTLPYTGSFGSKNGDGATIFWENVTTLNHQPRNGEYYIEATLWDGYPNMPIEQADFLIGASWR